MMKKDLPLILLVATCLGALIATFPDLRGDHRAPVFILCVVLAVVGIAIGLMCRAIDELDAIRTGNFLIVVCSIVALTAAVRQAIPGFWG